MLDGTCLTGGLVVECALAQGNERGALVRDPGTPKESALRASAVEWTSLPWLNIVAGTSKPIRLSAGVAPESSRTGASLGN